MKKAEIDRDPQQRVREDRSFAVRKGVEDQIARAAGIPRNLLRSGRTIDL